MKKYILAFVCTICAGTAIFLFLQSEPPHLKWNSMSCWNNSTFQVLRNIRPLTEALLKARLNATSTNTISPYELNDDDSKNDFMVAYVDLLEITTRTNTKNYSKEMIYKHKEYLEEKRNTFHMASCTRIKKTEEEMDGFSDDPLKGYDPARFYQFEFGGDWDSDEVGIMKKSKKIKDLFLTFLETVYPPHYANNIYFQDKNVLDDGGFKKLSDYFIQINISSQNVGFPVDFKLDLNPYVLEELKNESWKYELIGIVFGTTLHVKAYVKDQFEETPQWWLCDDIAEKYQLETNLEKISEKFEKVYIAVYKRIKEETSINYFAAALAQIASKK